MKLIVVLLVTFFATVAASLLIDTATLEREFEQFKRDFNKTYKNHLREFLAKNYFSRSLDFIRKSVKNDSRTFELSLNQFADLDPELIKNFTSLGMRPSAMLETRAVTFVNPANFPRGPPSIDFRDTGCVTPVKDQSYFCNSCYAFSAIASLESIWCLKNNVSVSLSEQQVISCSVGFSGNNGCGGGSQGPSYLYIQTIAKGIESDRTYPYADTYWHPTPFPCKYNSSSAVATTSGYFRIRSQNETEIANIIAKVGPISAAMNGGIPTFWYYSRGVYNDPACIGSMSHSVTIIGYGTDNSYDPPMPYWLCKNSWSRDWGEGGYFKIKRGVNLCGIAAFLVYPGLPDIRKS